ncbi:MAG: leucyl aminopeptidase [bacterium]
MKIILKAKEEIKDLKQTAALFCFEPGVLTGYKEKTAKDIVVSAQKEAFTGKLKQTVIIHPNKPDIPERVIIAGLGTKKEVSFETIRNAAAGVIKAAEHLKISSISLFLPLGSDMALNNSKVAAAVAEAIILSSYRFNKYQTIKEDQIKPLDSVNLIVPDKKTANQLKGMVEQAVIIAEGVCMVRDLVNEPSSAKYPQTLAGYAKKLSKPGSITVKVYEKADLEKMQMGGILGVSRGSHQPPVFIHLTYKPKKPSKKTIVFVGKGITFDSGGINIKPSNHLETMKMDMAGAAMVLGLFKILQNLNLPINVHGLVPSAENMPGGGAMKPSDVIKTHSGKTIEVLNTDAEGRLILADALAYGDKLNPEVMIDMATLTGSIVVGLGPLITGMMGTAQKEMNQIQALSEDYGEYFVQLPLLKEYTSQMKSIVADVKNIGSGKGGGPIIAGLFLKNFVDKTPWIHLDIAGTAWTDNDMPYCPRHGTGVPLRTLVNWLLEK